MNISAREIARSRTGAYRKAILTLAGMLVALAVLAALASPAKAETFTVNSTDDPGDGTCDTSECTLREAIEAANTNDQADTITFATGLGDTITLDGSELVIDSEVTIEGPGADQLTVDADGNSSSVFHTIDGSDATIEGLKITGGGDLSTGGLDGGIYNSGTLTVNATTISGNTASEGGGIYNNGTLTVEDSTINDNSAVEDGGGISNTGTLTVKNSTISGNSASEGGGGGILNENGPTTIEYTTITDNSAPDGEGSGVATYGDDQTSTEVGSSIISGNENSDVDYSSENTYASEGYNIIGDGNAVDGNTFNEFGDLTGVSDPGLGPLSENGGSTETHALLTDSDAIDNVDDGCPPPYVDQRGFTRPQGGKGGGAVPLCDSGSFELQAAAMQIEPTSAGYGEQQVDTQSDPKSFEITNAGEASLQIVNVDLEGTGAASFAIQNDRCENTTLSGGESCTVEVVFSPTTEGDKSAELVVESNASSSPDDVELTGIGTKAPDTPDPPKKNPNACTIRGDDRNNVLRGTPGRDVICGFGGNDIIRGLGGNDIIRGGRGNDIVRGGPGRDRILGGGGRDALSGQGGNDRILGGPGNDALLGGRGRDVLLGGPGNDVLVGGPGRDVERGGPGRDSTS